MEVGVDHRPVNTHCTSAANLHQITTCLDTDMDYKSHIKMMINSMIDNGDILMCEVLREKSGSTLLKLRLDKIEISELPGGATQNSNIQYKLKSQKQCQRDTDRVHQDKQKNHISSRTRSKVEIPRGDGQNSDNFTGVASPEKCVGSPLYTETPELQCYASPPVMREIVNTYDSCSYPVNDSHKVDSLTDSHRVDSVSEVQDELVGETIEIPSYDMMQSVSLPEDGHVTESDPFSDPIAVAELNRVLNVVNLSLFELQNSFSKLDQDLQIGLPIPKETSPDNSDDNGPT